MGSSSESSDYNSDGTPTSVSTAEPGRDGHKSKSKKSEKKSSKHKKHKKHKSKEKKHKQHKAGKKHKLRDKERDLLLLSAAVQSASSRDSDTNAIERPMKLAPKQPMKKLTQDEIEAARRGIAIQSKPKQIMRIQTKEDYDAEQSKVRKVWDEDSGRMRLVRGSGEIIEEIVSRSRQQEINKAATSADGVSFLKTLGLAKQ
eukprot:m.202193 g.202193  ORF g.202193 m.202193 type:complete len:201 (+) comp18820_c0_seq2:277-879(+)